MCGRFEGKEKVRITLASRVIFFLLTLYVPVYELYAQVPEYLADMVEDMAQEGVGNSEELLEHFILLADNPVDINLASLEELEATLLFSPFVAASIVEYRREYGYIGSMAELALVDGLDSERVASIEPFITIDPQKERDEGRSALGKVKHRLSYRMKSGAPASMLLKYKLESSDKSSVGFTLERDRGEKCFPDFTSLHFSVKDIPLNRKGSVKIKSALFGDYTLRFGQGVILWNSFSLSSLSDPSSIQKRAPNPAAPYTSSGESGFFRGGAVTLDLHDKNELSIFYSSNMLDARVEGDTFYSLPEGGEHITAGQIASKGNLREEMIGANYTRLSDSFRAGITILGYHYDKRDGRRCEEYNRHRRFQGWWGNISLDFLYLYRGLRLFGEVAFDPSGAFGGIVGGYYPISGSMESALTLRYYDPRFLALYSGSYRLSSWTDNQYGVTLSWKWRPLYGLETGLSGGYTRFPSCRFRVENPSGHLRLDASVKWNPSSSHLVSLDVGYKGDSGVGSSLVKGRLGYCYTAPFGLRLSTRIECNYTSCWGILGYQEVQYVSRNERWNLSVRVTLHDIKEWEGRIYCYERDLPSAFSTPVFYGRGISYYLTAQWKPLKWLNLSAKYSKDYWAFFILIFFPG